jgi:SAM-dependent methyltransferase
MNSETVASYFSGHKIYGDDFKPEEIEEWFQQEENGYAELGYVDSETDFYPYHGMNLNYGWRYVLGNYPKALGIGSAFAAEFEIMAPRIGNITVIEPGKKFWRTSAFGKQLNYVMPETTGKINFADDQFDLVTVFGVLHHIPNVSYVLSELVRVLRPGGYLLLREPIISMGDWRRHRPGLTKNERGIPLLVMQDLIAAQGCELIAENLIGFSPLQKIANKLKLGNYWDSSFLRKTDWLLCKIFAWNHKYHRTSLFDRFSPSTGYWVVRKFAD